MKVTELPNVYVGTRKVTAMDITLGEYNQRRGWDIPANEDPEEQGYIITLENGDTTYQRKDAFDETYKVNGALSYSSALEYLKKGYIIARSGWNGKNMFVGMLTQTTDVILDINGARHLFGASKNMVLFNLQKGSYDPWVASSSDTLAEDWFINFDINTLNGQ